MLKAKSLKPNHKLCRSKLNRKAKAKSLMEWRSNVLMKPVYFVYYGNASIFKKYRKVSLFENINND